jgi:hypothetical protein
VLHLSIDLRRLGKSILITSTWYQSRRRICVVVGPVILSIDKQRLHNSISGREQGTMFQSPTPGRAGRRRLPLASASARNLLRAPPRRHGSMCGLCAAACMPALPCAPRRSAQRTGIQAATATSHVPADGRIRWVDTTPCQAVPWPAVPACRHRVRSNSDRVAVPSGKEQF